MQSNQQARTALIVGATGFVGSKLLALLARSPKYQQIICVTRRSLDLDSALKNEAKIHRQKVHNIVVDFDQLESHQDQMKADDVFCCLGTTIKVAGSQAAFKKVDYDYCLATAQVTLAQGAEHFLLITAIGADTKSLAFYSRVKGELESSVTELGFKNFSVFRPSLLVGERSEFRLGEAIGEKVMGIANLALKGPLAAYHTISGEEVAGAMLGAALAAMDSPARGKKVYTYQKMQQLMQQAS